MGRRAVFEAVGALRSLIWRFGVDPGVGETLRRREGGEHASHFGDRQHAPNVRRACKDFSPKL